MCRLSLLDEVDDLIRGNCGRCTLINKIPHRDILAVDRVICASCPVGSRLLELGGLLDEDIRMGREGKEIPIIYDEPEPVTQNVPVDRKPGPVPELTRDVYRSCIQNGMMQKEIAIKFGVNTGSMKYWARKWKVNSSI